MYMVVKTGDERHDNHFNVSAEKKTVNGKLHLSLIKATMILCQFWIN